KCFGGLALGKLDDAQHLQSVEMVGPLSKDLRIKALGFREAPLCVERERLRKDLRHFERRWFRHRRHELHPLVSRGKKALLSRLARSGGPATAFNGNVMAARPGLVLSFGPRP